MGIKRSDATAKAFLQIEEGCWVEQPKLQAHALPIELLSHAALSKLLIAAQSWAPASWHTFLAQRLAAGKPSSTNTVFATYCTTQKLC